MNLIFPILLSFAWSFCLESRGENKRLGWIGALPRLAHVKRLPVIFQLFVYFPDNSWVDQVSDFEHKTLACLKITTEARAKELKARHTDSTFIGEILPYAKYFLFVSGPFATLDAMWT